MLRIDHKLDQARQQTGFAVVVFVPASLEGEDIADVAYTTFNAWGVGTKKGDDGVLLVIAPQEKKTRIETGKGVGGALTDLQSSHINREVINPLLKQGQYFEAIDKGTDAILHELVTRDAGRRERPGKRSGRVEDESQRPAARRSPPPSAVAQRASRRSASASASSSSSSSRSSRRRSARSSSSSSSSAAGAAAVAVAVAAAEAARATAEAAAARAAAARATTGRTRRLGLCQVRTVRLHLPRAR